MNVPHWIEQALHYGPKQGLTIHQIQRYIDEHFYEEFALSTLQEALEKQVAQGVLLHKEDRYVLKGREGGGSAFDALFKD